ncbi:MarR family winged helix-turn-helix transcriptional regulator [Bifidobacterium platyrrhinorum]|uniref:MarR family transcriptional regulator n=1 Tax=Bifidobacterium platyrrhinorum TaxID=2661628 RepID=A0A6L9SVS2_9BIFI|nr:MarR family transcriptional regulator [Bifidobacterium platyrrhinorum]NEG55261.1 MarR family transcriptional regulator [Bifidobacterium platyrrhinorum]
MGFEDEAVEELYSKVWSHRSAMQRELNRGAHGEVFALRQLACHGEMTPSQLAESLRVSSGRVSTVLSSLERKGFVTRTPDPSDRRVVRVAITEAGRGRVEEDLEDMRSAVRWIFSQMGERRTREFVELTREFMTYMSICHPGQPRPTAEEVRKAFEGNA